MNKLQEWQQIPKQIVPICDLCPVKATWQHPAGGLRCKHCPKPILARSLNFL